jgi:hypothetical protein
MVFDVAIAEKQIATMTIRPTTKFGIATQISPVGPAAPAQAGGR